MSESTRFGMSSLSADARRIGSDLAEMIALRRQLAHEEIRSDMAAARRLAFVGGTGAVLAITGLPIIAVAVALLLEIALGGDVVAAWTLLAAGPLSLLIGLTAVWAAWRRFRRDLVGFRESLAELREDVEWLREWIERHEADQ